MKSLRTVYQSILATSTIALVLPLVGCVGLEEPYRPYNPPSYNYPTYPNSQPSYYGYEADRARHERRELEKERAREEAERKRLERERHELREQEHRDYDRDEHHRAPPPPKPEPEHCPAGYHPSNTRCTNDQRRHGCKDVRISSTLGCKNM